MLVGLPMLDMDKISLERVMQYVLEWMVTAWGRIRNEVFRQAVRLLCVNVFGGDALHNCSMSLVSYY